MSFVLSPQTVEEAVGLLLDLPDALPMSGGASLVAMKNARLIEASHFVSLAGIASLHGITQTDSGLRIGGMTRHAQIAACDLLTGDLGMVRHAAGQIANRVVRNMGTIGGAVGNADPAADFLPVLACADARIELTGPDSSRLVAMEDYITGWYETLRAPAEIVTAIHLPAPRPYPSVYRKLCRVPGDYATASVACASFGDGVRVAVGACGPGPIRSPEAEAALQGKLRDASAIAALGAALADLADPVDDVRGTSEFRLRLIPRMVAAAISDLDGES